MTPTTRKLLTSPPYSDTELTLLRRNAQVAVRLQVATMDRVRREVAECLSRRDEDEDGERWDGCQ
jgi:hypothetical protein